MYDSHPNRVPNANLPVRPPLDYYGSTGYRDKYYYPSNNQPEQPLQPVPIGNLPSHQWQQPNPNDVTNFNNGHQPPLSYMPPNNKNQWPTEMGNKNLPPVVLNVNNGQSQQPVVPNVPAAPPNTVVQPAPIPEQPPKGNEGKSKPPAKEDTPEEESDSGEEEEEKTAPPKAGKSRGKHRKLDASDQGMPTFPPIYQQLKAIGSELDGEIIDHDGASDRPTGAVVSLVIGVFITAILGIFISCRIKTVGRRIRRTGKGPYAHDADFLVNGMYL